MGRLQRWYLATGLAACAIYLVLPSSDGAEVLFTLIAVSVPVVGFIALHRDQPRPKRGWFVLTSGFAVSALAEALCLTLVTWALEPQSTTVINSLFLLGYLVQLAGLLMIIQSRTTGRSRSSWLDAAAVGVATFTIIWSTLYAHLVQSSDSWLDWTTQLGEPVLGVALIAMSLRLAMGERRGFAVFGLFGAGYALQAATDLSANLLESYERGGLVDASWAVCYVLFGANLLSPGRLRPPQQAPSVLARREVQQALLLQGAVIIGVIGAIVVRATPSLQVSFVAVWVGAGAILLVLNRLRLFALFRMVSDASETENQRRLKALVDNSHEVIALADPDGVLRYVSSSVESMTGSPADEWIGTTFEEVINRYLPGIRDFVDVADGLSIGDRATWEGELIETAEGKRRTISITVVNHVDTPEVAGWVITARDVTDEARLTSELRHQALHDTLTGLPNRAHALVDEVLAQLGALGIRIAIDDFGTGYSSLAYLRQLAVDVVKIDQSFVRDLDTNSDHQALTRTMLALAEGLSMVAIAEGVETDAELAVLQRLGCEFAQGYLFSYPVTAEAIGRLLMPAEPVEQQLGPDRGAQQPIGVR